MRVVFLTHNYPRWPGDLSGSFLGTLADGAGARAASRCASSRRATRGRAARRRSDGVSRAPGALRLRPAARRWPTAARWRPRLRAPGRLAGARRTLAGASAGRPRGGGGGRATCPRALVGAGRPRGAARCAAGPDRARHRRRDAPHLPARPPARAAGVRPRASRDRGLARARGLGPERHRPAHRRGPRAADAGRHRAPGPGPPAAAARSSSRG